MSIYTRLLLTLAPLIPGSSQYPACSSGNSWGWGKIQQRDRLGGLAIPWTFFLKVQSHERRAQRRFQKWERAAPGLEQHCVWVDRPGRGAYRGSSDGLLWAQDVLGDWVSIFFNTYYSQLHRVERKEGTSPRLFLPMESILTFTCQGIRWRGSFRQRLLPFIPCSQNLSLFSVNVSRLQG